MSTYPKRLIEVDLPIKRISAHARREKSIRHGHISTLHIWWARRPLAACRAVICASLWPDPADSQCPPAFRVATATALCAFAERVRTDAVLAGLCADSWARWNRTNSASMRPDDPACWPDMRYALLDFIADFANWDASAQPAFLDAARALTQAAHEALGGLPGTRPLVVDPFAGGGSIPLEALRVGADAFASDLNPVAVLLNKVVLEYIPRYGQQLADEVRKWGAWIKEQAEKELAEFYPKDPDGATPIAYLWARTVRCEGPNCGAEVPLMRSVWLAKKGSRSVALRLLPDPAQKRVDFEIIQGARARDVGDGTVRRGSATCPVCGFTTPVTSVRTQLKARRGGAADARLFCVVTTRPGQQGRFYRLPNDRDLEAARLAADELRRRAASHTGPLSLVPDEELDVRGIRHTWAMLYGIERWRDLFTPRQSLAVTSLARLVCEVSDRVPQQAGEGLATAVQTCLALALDRQADHSNSACTWNPSGPKVQHLFTRQAVPMVWDFAEAAPLGDSVGDWSHAVECVLIALRNALHFSTIGQAQQASATAHPLPDGTASAVVTDPPYYDAVPYAYLSDFFYVWQRRVLSPVHPDLLGEPAVPKDAEIVVDRPHVRSHSTHDVAFYQAQLTNAFVESHRILHRDSIGLIVFASKTTASWEAIVQAVLHAGWTITGSWPIDTEMATRVSAQGQARLASSVHLVCRPRENLDGSLTIDTAGDWRDVLEELPRRIHDWMPRLVSEGVVGADAIFACLGPALEIFSRYARVEKASGEPVKLGEYLEHVWAAVSHEALSLLFHDADAAGLEPDARLTAMWLWTLSTAPANGNGGPADDADLDEDEEGDSGAKPAGAYSLEYDAARKIAQGLGAHLDKLDHVVQVRGKTARLLTVAERAPYLFGQESPARSARGRSRPTLQPALFAASAQSEEESVSPALQAPPAGATALDRVHQAMLLFAAGRAEALRRFLVDQGAGSDARFWQLAQSLSALYPAATEEKRWVDGVLARKKNLGF